MKKIKFGIKPGFSAQDLLSEISNRVSGETQEQIEVLEKELKSKGAMIDSYIDPVRGYALVRIQVKGKDIFKFPTLGYLYYLLGINDEGLYFAHEIDASLVPRFKGMESLLDWVNRTDEGFCERVQGDILLQYIKPQYLFNDLRGKISNLDDPGTMIFREPQNEIDFRIPNMGVFRVRVENTLTNLDIGNHRIISERAWSQAVGDAFVIAVMDREFKVQHPQHGITTIQVPKGHAAILTHQRGRVFNGRPQLAD